MLCSHGLPVEGAPAGPVGPVTTSTRPYVVRRLPDPPSLLTPGIERDPYPLYRSLRKKFPLVYDQPFGAWLVSRYADVRAALADPRLVAPPPGRTLAHLEGARTARTGRSSHRRSADTPSPR